MTCEDLINYHITQSDSKVTISVYKFSKSPKKYPYIRFYKDYGIWNRDIETSRNIIREWVLTPIGTL